MEATYDQVLRSVVNHSNNFVRWPKWSHCLWPGSVRVKYHQFPAEIKTRLKEAGIPPDSRSNGPAICSFLLAGGERPIRETGKGWNIHHIYDGKFPFTGRSETTHAVKDGRYFTEAAGLVALHPIADALADEFREFALWLRHEAFKRFKFDPDGVFS